MEFFDNFANIVLQIESVLNVRLTDEHFADARDELAHVFLHETCHAAIVSCVPWIHDLTEKEHTALDEILARLLEREMGLLLGLSVHSPEEHVRELANYPVRISVEQYLHLQTEWQRQYWHSKDMKGMAIYALKYLRAERVTEN